MWGACASQSLFFSTSLAYSKETAIHSDCTLLLYVILQMAAHACANTKRSTHHSFTLSQGNNNMQAAVSNPWSTTPHVVSDSRFLSNLSILEGMLYYLFKQRWGEPWLNVKTHTHKTKPYDVCSKHDLTSNSATKIENWFGRAYSGTRNLLRKRASLDCWTSESIEHCLSGTYLTLDLPTLPYLTLMYVKLMKRHSTCWSNEVLKWTQSSSTLGSAHLHLLDLRCKRLHCSI